MTAAQYVEANLNTPMDEFYRNGLASGFTIQELRIAVRERAQRVSIAENGEFFRF